MVLLIDHFDSFVHNQARYLQRMGIITHVQRCDEIDVSHVRELNPQAIVLSPGPCTPAETGATPDIVRQFLGEIPLLGICLGHQTLAAVTGGNVVRAAHPCHGRASRIRHDGQHDFRGVSQHFRAGRYHSLVVDELRLPSGWDATAHTSDGALMAMRHRETLACGWQFHPESVLTEQGYELFANFFRLAGIAIHAVPATESEIDLNRNPHTSHAVDQNWDLPRSSGDLPLSF